jgi:hypothetical protein
VADAPTTGDQYTQAVGQLRTTAQWLVTASAGVGAVIVAGLALKSIGGLHDLRLVGAVAAAIIGVTAVAVAIWFISDVLMPIGASPNDLKNGDDFKALRGKVQADPDLVRGEGVPNQDIPGLLAAYDQVSQRARDEYAALISDPTKGQGPYQAASGRLDQVGAVLTAIEGLGIYLAVTRRFKTARLALLIAALVATAAAALFAYCANPPEATPSAAKMSSEVTAAPIVRVHLTSAGEQSLKPELGASCDLKRLRAAIVGGTTAKPQLVTLPEAGCHARTFTLTSSFGTTATG